MTISRGDHIYFKGKDGPSAGEVICHGKHGATVTCAKGLKHKVKWDNMLGHKSRLNHRFTVEDEGEDGAILKRGDGKRVFVHADADTDESDDEMKKAIVFLKANRKNRPGLHLEKVTDKRGVQAGHWVKNSDPAKEKRTKKSDDQPRGKRLGKEGDGQSISEKLESGAKAIFKVGNVEGSGKVVASGKDGVIVEDKEGNELKIRHDEVREQGSEQKSKGEEGADDNRHAADSESFSGADYYAKHNKEEMTEEEVLKLFPAEAKEKLNDVLNRVNALEPTVNTYRRGGSYTEERQLVHKEIIEKYITPDAVISSKPGDGEKPTFTILGGRGGSGKSWFKGKVFDPSNVIYLDSDEIKEMLPEYKGWNAAQVYAEAGDIFDKITDIASEMGLNIVHDSTMRSTKTAVDLVKKFKSTGYSVDAHYMHLPRHEAAKRAVSRSMGNNGRFVPLQVILGSKTNEESFDAIKGECDKWSFRDNNVEMGDEPVLISESTEQLRKSIKVCIFKL